MTLPGRDRSAPRILIGSHLDSVPQGGNFDGAAGVVAGLCVARRACAAPASCPPATSRSWASAPRNPPGSTSPTSAARGAFGLLDPACLAMPPLRQRPSLEETLMAAGLRSAGDPRAAPPAGSRADPRLSRAAHRAGPDAGRAGPARRRRDRDPRLQAISQCALHRRVRAIRAPYRAPIATMRSPRPWRCCTTWRALWLQQEAAGADLVAHRG